MYSGFDCHRLDPDHVLWIGHLPEHLVLSAKDFGVLWDMHPAEFHEIKMHGRLVKTLRWQQAYGADYHYTGRVNKALPMPSLLDPLLDWARATIDPRLNGLLVNWYEPRLNHYIGKHRDSTTHMIVGAPIAMISFGGDRVFRMRRWRGQAHVDFPVTNGSVIIMPYDTNLTWTHEVLPGRETAPRRISVTIRGFEAKTKRNGAGKNRPKPPGTAAMTPSVRIQLPIQ